MGALGGLLAVSWALLDAFMVLLGSSWGPPGGYSCVVAAQKGDFQKYRKSLGQSMNVGCDLDGLGPSLSLLGGLNAAWRSYCSVLGLVGKLVSC